MLKGRLVVQYFIDFCSTSVLHEGIVLIYFEDVVLGGPARKLVHARLTRVASLFFGIMSRSDGSPHILVIVSSCITITQSLASHICSVCLCRGFHNVTCTALDRSGNIGAAIITLSVVDQEAPLLSLPARVTAVLPEGSSSGNISFLKPSAFDAVDGVLSDVTCVTMGGGLVTESGQRLSGVFRLGLTILICSVSDHSGNVATGELLLTVASSAGPSIPLQSCLRWGLYSSLLLLLFVLLVLYTLWDHCCCSCGKRSAQVHKQSSALVAIFVS